MTGIREIRAMLQERVHELISALPGLSNGRFAGATYVVRNPTREDRQAGSFIIWTRGAAAGGFRDYASDDAGDVIDLIAFVHGRCGDRRFALRWAREFLGLAQMTHSQRIAAERKAHIRAAAAADAVNQRAEWTRRRANELWTKAQPSLVDTPAELYLAHRGIVLAAIPQPEQDLRFAPALEWWEGATWDNGRKLASGPKFPAIVAAVRDRHGDITAVHCTFLRHSGEAKADVAKPKLMFGQVRGSVIRLARGPSGLTPEQAALHGRRDLLVISEGIENGLTVAIACPEPRVWAATSLSNLRNVPVDHPCIGGVIVAADNDVNPQAGDALDAALETLKGYGVRVECMRAYDAKDFNDMIR